MLRLTNINNNQQRTPQKQRHLATRNWVTETHEWLTDWQTLLATVGEWERKCVKWQAGSLVYRTGRRLMMNSSSSGLSVQSTHISVCLPMRLTALAELPCLSDFTQTNISPLYPLQWAKDWWCLRYYTCIMFKYQIQNLCRWMFLGSQCQSQQPQRTPARNSADKPCDWKFWQCLRLTSQLTCH